MKTSKNESVIDLEDCGTPKSAEDANGLAICYLFKFVEALGRTILVFGGSTQLLMSIQTAGIELHNKWLCEM